MDFPELFMGAIP